MRVVEDVEGGGLVRGVERVEAVKVDFALRCWELRRSVEGKEEGKGSKAHVAVILAADVVGADGLDGVDGVCSGEVEEGRKKRRGSASSA